MKNSEKNKAFLDSLNKPRKKELIKIIAEHYDVSDNDIIEELTSNDGSEEPELVYEYLPTQELKLQIYTEMNNVF